MISLDIKQSFRNLIVLRFKGVVVIRGGSVALGVFVG